MSEPLTPAEHTARIREALELLASHDEHAIYMATQFDGTVDEAALESLDALSAALADRDARIQELERLRKFADSQWVACETEVTAARARIQELLGERDDARAGDRANFKRATDAEARIQELERAAMHDREHIGQLSDRLTRQASVIAEFREASVTETQRTKQAEARIQELEQRVRLLQQTIREGSTA